MSDYDYRVGEPPWDISDWRKWPLFTASCTPCARLIQPPSEEGPPRCEAFPDGIPAEIWLLQHDHRTPYPGDRGLTFLPKKMVARHARRTATAHFPLGR